MLSERNQKMKTKLQWQKADDWLPQCERTKSRMEAKGVNRKFWDDENVLYLGCGGFTDIYICQNSSNYVL